MDFDLPGRIKNTKLPFSGALLPIFEAVINSIHAVDESPILRTESSGCTSKEISRSNLFHLKLWA